MSERVWTHAVAAEDDIPFWRHGQAWATFRNMGRRNRPYNENRLDVEHGVEWNLIGTPFGIGAELKFGTRGSEHEFAASIHGGRLFSLWFHTTGWWPRSWLVPGYESRVARVNLGAFDGWDNLGLRATLWGKRHSWSSNSPWWEQDHRIDLNTFFGVGKTAVDVVETGVCVVPMPEANYPASFTVTRYTTRWPRRLGRLRGTRVRYSTTIKPGNGVPIPGKGENSWDLDDDAIGSSSSPGRNVSTAIGNLVASALRRRERHGGQHMNLAAES